MSKIDLGRMTLTVDLSPLIVPLLKSEPWDSCLSSVLTDSSKAYPGVSS